MDLIDFIIANPSGLCVPPLQMHPLGLCNSNDEEDLYEYGWVGVVKLEQPQLDPSCLTVLGKVSPCTPSSSHCPSSSSFLLFDILFCLFLLSLSSLALTERTKFIE